MGLFDKFTGNNDGPKTVNEQTPDEKSLAAFVKGKVEESRMSTSRISHEGIWMTNIAYILGFDGVFYDTSTRTFRSAQKGNQALRRNRVHSNKILPTLQNRLARLCKNPPKYDVRPDGEDEEAKERARLEFQVLMNVWEKQELNRKRIDLYMGKQQTGHSYIGICWDEMLGEEMLDPDSGDLCPEGDIRVDVVSAFEMFPDPLAKDEDELQSIVRAKVRKLDYFKSQYPDRGHLVKEEGVWLLSAQYDARINTMNALGQGQTGTQNIAKNCAVELRYYERPTPKYPLGRQITAANGVLLENKPLPVGKIPYVKFNDIKVYGKYYSEAMVTHIRPLQDQYNRNLAMRAQWTNKMLAGKYLAAKNSGLTSESLNDQSGEVVQYNVVPGAPPPTIMQTPSIPSYAYKEDEVLKGDIYDISGIGEISRGQVPNAAMPAIGMQFVMEQDETRIGIMTEDDEYAWARVGKLILRYANKYYKTERKLKISGKGGQYSIKSFTGSDISENPDVIVIRGSTVPGSKVLRRQEILNTFNSGLLGDPNDPSIREKVLDILEYGDVAGMWEDQNIDMQQIQNQIKEMENGVVPLFDQLQNHNMHILIKNRYKKSSKWNDLDPTRKAILEEDINKHVDFLVHLANPTLPSQMSGIENNVENMNKLKNLIQSMASTGETQ